MRKSFIDFLTQNGAVPIDRLQRIQGDRAHREPLGAIAFRHGLIGGDEIDAILDEQRKDKRPFGQIAVERGFLTQEQVADLLRIQDLSDVVEIAEALIVSRSAAPVDVFRCLSDYLPKLSQPTAPTPS